MAIPLYDTPDLPSADDFFDGEPSLPSFTTAIRGYQKDEVHAFLRELRQEHSDGARERHRLELEARALRRRITSLEGSIAAATPHTIDALGERMLLILHHAESAAHEAVSAAEAEATRLRQDAEQRAETHVRQASLRASQATKALKAAQAEAQRCVDKAHTEASTHREAERREVERIAAETMAAARGEADRLVAEARGRASALLADAQTQADTMVASAEAHASELAARAAGEAAAVHDEIMERRALADAQLIALANQRDELLAEMAQIHSSLARTLRASGFPEAAAQPAAETQAPPEAAADLPIAAVPEVEPEADTTQEQPAAASEGASFDGPEG